MDCAFPTTGCQAGWYISSALDALVRYASTNDATLMNNDANSTDPYSRSPIFGWENTYTPQRASCDDRIRNYIANPAQDKYPFRPFEYKKYDLQTLDQLKQAIQLYGAVAVNLSWDHPVTTDGITTFAGNQSPDYGHAVVIAGYDDARGCKGNIRLRIS